MEYEGLILVDGQFTGGLGVMDRGLQYGDGVFRTLKAEAGRLLWWADQYEKLHQDCQALRIHCPEASLLQVEAEQIAAKPNVSVVKIIVTRGTGLRGYGWPETAEPTRIVIGYTASQMNSMPVEVRWCSLRLSHQPQLAGIKHLNRLENVLARSEWTQPGIAEGLLMDQAGQVIGGTMTNLFIVEENTLVTPDLSNCGIRGVARTRLLRAAARHAQPVRIEPILPERVLRSDQVLLCNSLIGIWRVGKLGDKTWPDTGWADQLRYWLDEDH